jgi:Recombination endonuclease VII
MKTCTKCGESKPLEAFNARNRSPDGLRQDCRSCHTARTRANYLANRESRLEYKRRPEVLAANVVSKRKMLTGFTPELFAAAIAHQNGCCAICLVLLSTLPRKQIHADHCHATKRPRGVLCHSCNAALGHMKDDPDRLRRALSYLEEIA